MATQWRRFALVALLVAAAGSRSFGQELTKEQRREMAHRIIADSVRVKPRELVVIRGNAAFLPLMEDLAAEASKAGGYAVMMPVTDTFIRSVMTEVPDEYLNQPDPTIPWVKNTDVYINLPFLYDEAKVTEGVPAKKLATVQSVNQDEDLAAVRASKARSLFIDAPVPSQAALYGFDVASFSAMQWAAIGADEASIEETGKRLGEALKKAKSVHVTTPTGSDFTFKVGHQDAMVTGGVTHGEAAKWEDRNASLPGGSLAAAVEPGSFRGKIFTPEDFCPGMVKLTGVSYEFSDGKMTASKAQENDKCLQDYFGAYTGTKDEVVSVQIGLNSALKTQGKTAPTNLGGMLFVELGRDERFGATGTQMYWGIPVANATVSADGKNLIENGQLRLP
jgi:aminopeptidase